MAEILLKVKNLNVNYKISQSIFKKKKYKNILNNISFKIYQGESLALVGESGCGKTTIANTLVRIVKETKGKINFLNQNITNLTNKQLLKIRKDIQMIFQDPFSSLNPKMTIGKILSEGLIIHKIAKTKKKRKDIILKILKSVSLKEEHFNRYPHEFSGGQRQRIAIAKALVLKPKLIIADEALSSLDIPLQSKIITLLKTLQKQFNLSYLLISHDLAIVEDLCNRIIVLNKGEIVETNTTKEILKNPSHPYTKRLVKASYYKYSFNK